MQARHEWIDCRVDRTQQCGGCGEIDWACASGCLNRTSDVMLFEPMHTHVCKSTNVHTCVSNRGVDLNVGAAAAVPVVLLHSTRPLQALFMVGGS